MVSPSFGRKTVKERRRKGKERKRKERKKGKKIKKKGKGDDGRRWPAVTGGGRSWPELAGEGGQSSKSKPSSGVQV